MKKKPKIYKALGPDVVEKRFTSENANIPEGWFGTTDEAMAAWKAPTKKK